MTSGTQSFQFGAAQFVFDGDGDSGTLIKFSLPALQMIVIDRGQIPTDSMWEGSGIYFLYGLGDRVGTYRIYAGKAMNVRSRITTHDRLKEWWDRGLLVVADRSSGFTSSETAWLEARFIALLRNELGERVENKNQPNSDKLEVWKERELEAHVAPIEAVLRLLGALSVSSEPQIEGDDQDDEVWYEENESTKKLSWVEAALKVLPANGDGLHAKDILTRIVEGNYRDVSGAKTPENTLRRDLRVESQKEGGLVVQVGPSTFAVRIPG